jgi:hypothetical protein
MGQNGKITSKIKDLMTNSVILEAAVDTDTRSRRFSANAPKYLI